MDTVKEQHWWFKVERDRARRHNARLQPWWISGKAKGPRQGGYRESHKGGYAQFSLTSPRNQRVITNTDISKQLGGAGWAKHGFYLQRHGAQQDGRGLGFDTEGNAVSIPRTVTAWQRQNDPHLFKIVLGPDHPEQIDLQEFTRTVMREVSQLIGKPLTWVAIDHHNTTYAHVHVCLRGVSNGQELRFAKDYLWGGGLARQAGEILTRKLGWVMAPELEEKSRKAIVSRYFGQHDRSIFRKLDDNREVQNQQLTPVEKERLVELEKRDLAWKTEKGWQLAYQWKEKIKMDKELEHRPKEREQDRKQEREPQQKQEREQQKEQQREREEQEERQRRIRMIDQLEQERGR